MFFNGSHHQRKISFVRECGLFFQTINKLKSDELENKVPSMNAIFQDEAWIDHNRSVSVLFVRQKAAKCVCRGTALHMSTKSAKAFKVQLK